MAQDRRSFLRTMADTAGGAATVSAFPPAIQRALAAKAFNETGTIRDVKHVVILRQENRAFNHYFGTMKGLGPRVPMYVASPWSKGGWVCSQTFDHTSVGLFLEKRFGLKLSTVSPWHRAVCSDLSSALDSGSPNDPVFPALPDQRNWAAIEARQRMLPTPLPPATPQPLFQETGVRYSRAAL
jgi:phospholipase C